jgi:AcrR family transcriptional regulator
MSIPSNSRDVKPRRRYDSTRRQAQAAQTRQDIVAAALDLFVERGYAATTMAAIAQAAGVVVETIYRAFGSKAALLKEPDPRRVLELHAATQPGIHARAGPPLRVLMEAAAAHPELAEVWDQVEAQRLDGMRRLAQSLSDRGALRPGLSVEEAGDILWTVNSLAVYDLLVRQRGWAPERYRDWVAATNARALLADPLPGPEPGP